MKPAVRIATLTATILLALAACDKSSQATADGAKAEVADAAGKPTYPGLPTEKDQISYALGLSMGKQLAVIKDEISVDTVVKAVRAGLSGENALLTDDQAMEISQAFGEKMQAKIMAKRQEEMRKNQEAGDKFLAENAKKPEVKTTESGLQYQVLVEGTGSRPGPKDTVKVNYKGNLLDGEVFDSSYERGEPTNLPLGGVIEGWREGLQLMPTGSKYRFWIPAHLAYGENAPPMIGPNQMLEFEVELLEITKKFLGGDDTAPAQGGRVRNLEQRGKAAAAGMPKGGKPAAEGTPKKD